MQLAERFRLPLVTLIDTPGAYPGVGAEERGQSEAIARNLFEMSMLRIPIVSVVIGEGGSGGALAHRRVRPAADAPVLRPTRSSRPKAARRSSGRARTRRKRRRSDGPHGRAPRQLGLVDEVIERAARRRASRSRRCGRALKATLVRHSGRARSDPAG